MAQQRRKTSSKKTGGKSAPRKASSSRRQPAPQQSGPSAADIWDMFKGSRFFFPVITIVAHEFLGDSVEGMDILIVDDMISSGDSMIDIAREMKDRGARKVFCAVTFGLFTEGIDNFNKAYEEGIINKVFATNLIYRRPELLQAPWFADVNLCKFVALLIDAINHDASLSSLINPTEKIKNLLATKEKIGLNPEELKP